MWMLLHLTLAAAMMLPTMSEQTEPPERTANEPPEHVTFAEAAERLNITADAVRMRVHRGRLASIRVNERTFVLWPQPERLHEQHAERTRTEHRAAVQSDDRLVVALEQRIASLERQLDERTEEIRRRDHIIAGLVERVRELPAGDVSPDAPHNANTGTLRGDAPMRTPETSTHDQGPVWRRWWRRLTGA
jgi:hypothetical protein